MVKYKLLLGRNNKPKIFYKITNKQENHHGFQYQDGLNTIKVGFDPNPECASGSLYFADKKDIQKYFDFGENIREVVIPEDALLVYLGGKYKANKIILRKKYPLYSIKTYQKLKFPINHD